MVRRRVSDCRCHILLRSVLRNVCLRVKVVVCVVHMRRLLIIIHGRSRARGYSLDMRHNKGRIRECAVFDKVNNALCSGRCRGCNNTVRNVYSAEGSRCQWCPIVSSVAMFGWPSRNTWPIARRVRTWLHIEFTFIAQSMASGANLTGYCGRLLWRAPLPIHKQLRHMAKLGLQRSIARDLVP